MSEAQRAADAERREAADVEKEKRETLLRLTEWCGLWLGSVIPTGPGLRSPASEQLLDAAQPSLEEALAAYRQLVDRLIKPPG